MAHGLLLANLILWKSHPNLPHGNVLSSGGGMALGVRRVECIVASEVDQCQLCLADMQEGVDNEA